VLQYRYLVTDHIQYRQLSPGTSYCVSTASTSYVTVVRYHYMHLHELI
jgi:hypothetical protein